MRSRISLTLLICMTGAAIVVGALFLPAREVAAPNPPAATVPSPDLPSPETSATDGAAGPVEVSIASFTFSATGILQPGQEVLVTNNDSVPHTLTADDQSFDTGLLQPGEQAVITVPNQSGEFSFFCEVHPAMTGAFSVGT